MAKQKKQNKPEGQELLESYGRFEQYVNKNKNVLLGVIGGIVLLVAVFAWYKWMRTPKVEAKAQTAMFPAQQYFAMDSFNIALNGNAMHPGFLDIIDDYKGVPANNLAKYYAGMCFLHTGQYEYAIAYLDKFKKKEPVTGAMALSGIGDAYAELGDMNNAIKNYKQAASMAEDEFTKPMMLLKTGMALEYNQKYSEAKKYYEQLKEEFPNSNEGQQADKYIQRVSANI